MCVCVYICLFVCGLSCTFYDGLPWLGEQPLVIMGALNLVVWYALKAIAVGAYSYYILCMIITVCLSRSMSASDIGFPVYVTCINMLDALVSFNLPLYEHANAFCIHRHETLLVCHSTPNAKLYRIFAMKMGTFVVVFLQRKLSEDSVLCAITN